MSCTFTAARSCPDAVTAIWQGRVEVDRFNELVLRAGLSWQQVILLRAYAKYLRQAGFPYSQSRIESVLNENTSTARSLVALFEAMFDPDSSAKGLDARAAARSVATDIDALTSLDTDRVLLTGGPSLRAVGSLAGLRIPAGAARHTVAVLEPHEAFAVDRMPMVFDIGAGLYWRLEEGGLLLDAVPKSPHAG